MRFPAMMRQVLGVVAVIVAWELFGWACRLTGRILLVPMLRWRAELEEDAEAAAILTAALRIEKEGLNAATAQQAKEAIKAANISHNSDT